ncbi:hypothetical protein ACWENR_13090 [Micromonospora sp. NPDC004336]
MVGWRLATSGYGPTTTTRTTGPRGHDPVAGTETSPDPLTPARPPADPYQEPMCFPALVTYCT